MDREKTKTCQFLLTFSNAYKFVKKKKHQINGSILTILSYDKFFTLQKVLLFFLKFLVDFTLHPAETTSTTESMLFLFFYFLLVTGRYIIKRIPGKLTSCGNCNVCNVTKRNAYSCNFANSAPTLSFCTCIIYALRTQC